MAKYPATKILKRAKPKVRLSDGVVITWFIEVLYTHTRQNGTTWSTTYDHEEDVEYMNKLPTEFTQAELINFMPSNREVIFDAHYEAHNTPPADEVLNEFSINDLAKG